MENNEHTEQDSEQKSEEQKEGEVVVGRFWRIMRKTSLYSLFLLPIFFLLVYVWYSFFPSTFEHGCYENIGMEAASSMSSWEKSCDNIFRETLINGLNFILTIIALINLLIIFCFLGAALRYIRIRQKRKFFLRRTLLPLGIVFFILFAYVPSESFIGKPVIYLYPTEPQETEVGLDFVGDLTVTYPEYDDGWKVMAYPDGTVIDLRDGREYSYLFWEGIDRGVRYDLSKGFVVKGEDTAEFLQTTLAELGMTPKEYNEFIVFWLPHMLQNKYNLIHFADESEYHERAVLDIEPRPDSMLRVFMVFKGLSLPREVEAQVIKPFERKGFAVVEWGGTEL